MEIEFKPDFEKARERWAAFWRGESRRPMLHAIRPKPGVTPVKMPRPYSCADGDLEPKIQQTLAWAASHDFLGDTIPTFLITLAPDHFAALLGGEIKIGQGTGTNWVEPCVKSLDEEIRFRPEGRWWRRTVECVEKFRAKCDGKLIITGSHWQGGLDCLAALYGTENLLTDLAMEPEKVHRALDRVDVAMAEVRKAMSGLLDIPRWGASNRFWMYCSGAIDVPECDVSCMIGREMFDEFELPHLTREVAGTDASIYHLDGIGAVQHLESLCSIKQLDMIQWMPGEGHYEEDWNELHARIDALGKGQIFQPFYKMNADDVKRAWDTFKSRKLFFHVAPEDCLALLKHYGE